MPLLCHNTSPSSNSIKSDIVFAEDKYTLKRESEWGTEREKEREREREGKKERESEIERECERER